MNNLLTTTQAGYENIAVDFSSTRHKLWPDLQPFLHYIKKNDRILDLGCGNGRLLELLKNSQIDYLGVDNSKKLIRLAREKYPGVEFIIHDALAPGLKPQTYDVIISAAVLNHFPTPAMQLKFLQQAKKALKPAGYLLLSNWNLWNVNNKKGLQAFKREKRELAQQQFYQKYHFNKIDLGVRDVLTVWGREQAILYYYAFTKSELAELLKQAGFRIIDNYYSLAGNKAPRDGANNIITIAQKK